MSCFFSSHCSTEISCWRCFDGYYHCTVVRAPLCVDSVHKEQLAAVCRTRWMLIPANVHWTEWAVVEFGREIKIIGAFLERNGLLSVVKDLGPSSGGGCLAMKSNEMPQSPEAPWPGHHVVTFFTLNNKFLTTQVFLSFGYRKNDLRIRLIQWLYKLW